MNIYTYVYIYIPIQKDLVKLTTISNKSSFGFTMPSRWKNAAGSWKRSPERFFSKRTMEKSSTLRYSPVVYEL